MQLRVGIIKRLKSKTLILNLMFYAHVKKMELKISKLNLVLIFNLDGRSRGRLINVLFLVVF